MPNDTRRPILGFGEKYMTPLDKPGHGRPGPLPRTYDEARLLVKKQIGSALENLVQLPRTKRYDDESVLCLRLHPDRTAKSYEPSGLLEVVRDLENIGSRSYRLPGVDVKESKRIKKLLESGLEEVTGRLVFIRSNDAGFKRLLKVLDRSEQSLPKKFIEDVRSIERFDLLCDKERFFFPEGWKEGRVEIVLHPTRHSQEDQMNFLGALFASEGNPRIQARPYPNGPTFISCYLSAHTLDAIADANPLRSVHPLIFGGLDNLRSAAIFQAPLPPTGSTSTIRVGMFDGGIDPQHPYLKGHAVQDENLSIDTTPDPDYISHGTAVAGAILYGPLNAFGPLDELPLPRVSVVSVRALPPSSKTDPDLYECIDVIEEAVAVRSDVNFWNISFGPRGPINIDSISRFTYVLDSLAAEHKVGFCVAVGNDGDAGNADDLNRIQSPSDLVNGLGVGAHTVIEKTVKHATYSCQGPGRECGKVKPEVTAFGGCSVNPIHLLSPVSGKRMLHMGTSFACPQVVSLAAQTLGYIDRASPLLARTLVVQTATHHEKKPDNYFGFGAIAQNFDDVVRCGGNNVTVIFQGSLLPSKHEKLPLMLPKKLVESGKVKISWTIACLPSVNASHPGDYTSMCILDTFFPSEEKYSYTPPKELKGVNPLKLHIKDDAEQIATLIKAKWKKSKLPIPDSPKYRTEDQQRAEDQKWEPLVKRVITKQASSLCSPFLVLHTIPRKGATKRLDFAAAITISAPSYKGDLYNAILRSHPALQPVRLRAESELRVQV